MERIGKYEVLGELGQGASGRLYKAFDRSIARQVAIKVLHSAADQNQLARFQSEAAAAGNLHHKNVVSIYDFDIQNGRPFLVMELLEGQNLSSLMSRGRPPLVQAVDIMQQAAQGLAHAHCHGVIHGDVSPSNIWLTPDGTVKIIDFGAALKAQGDETATKNGDSLGTLLYVAPERLSVYGASPDARSDIFSYGVVYYQLISGQHPFVRDEADARVVRCNISMNDPVPIRQLMPLCPQRLAEVIHRACAKDPELRYQSFDDLQLETEPVLIELQRQSAEKAVERAGARVRAGQPEGSRSTGHHARELYDEIQPQFDRQELGARVETELQSAEGAEDIERARVRHLHEQLAVGKRLLAQKQFPEAITLLEGLQEQFPEPQLIPPLLAYGREAMRTAQRAQTVEHVTALAQSHAAYAEFDAAQQAVEEALRIYPCDSVLSRLLEAIAKAKGAHERSGQPPGWEAASSSPETCAHCGALLPGDMKFCDNCGRSRGTAVR